MSRTSARCRSGKYHGVASGSITCDYILDTKKRRGCPAGPGCTKYEKGVREKTLDLGPLSAPKEGIKL